ncbi:MAG: hypothetical protein E7472_06940 [Ruminococcaceae bacterium]|nr:hypothetical protein [Oscillospiraceae bacterium]
MADKITNYKCPACGGPLQFSNETQDLMCEYCESHFPVAEVEAMFEQKNAAAVAAAEKQTDTAWEMEGGEGWGADGDKMSAYSCPSCGAELICDKTTAATSCPYCGNPSIVPGQFDGALKPDLVLPFRLDKEAAKAALRNHYKGKKLLPAAFADENHIEEIKGVYVPFWLFDGKAEGDLQYEGTRSHTRETHNERITTTEHYSIRRAGTVEFEKIPVDASSKMPDAHMDAIEPFDYVDLKPFSMAYLPGFLADKYDVSVEGSAARVQERIENTVREALRESCVGYETVNYVGGSIGVERGKVHYALLPVWMLSTKWNGQNFLFAMNGQTGKLIGDLPIDKGRFWKYFFLTAGIVAAVVTAAATVLL